MKKSIYLYLTIILSVAVVGCKNSDKKKDSERATLEYAKKLSQKFIITDGHVDLPHRMMKSEEWIDVSKRTSEGDFDFVRAMEGGLNAPFMSIYVPATYQKDGGAKEYADGLIDMVHKVETEYPDKFKVVKSLNEANKAIKEGKIALPMGMENGAPIEDDISNVAYFHERGIRYITLTHSKDNLICDSSYDDSNTWNGLSEFGKEVVKEMNRVGIMVDVSHITDSTFYQVMDITKVPVIASHSSCRHFTPGFERNMNDDMIKRLTKNDGVIQINFGSSFLDKAVVDKNKERTKMRDELSKEFGDDEAKLKVAQDKFDKENSKFYSTVEKVADHIDRVVELAGIDHVGLGSDYDGVGDSLPTGLKDVSQYPNLIFELLKRGYSDEDIEKICYKNVWRVWKKVEDYASKNS